MRTRAARAIAGLLLVALLLAAPGISHGMQSTETSTAGAQAQAGAPTPTPDSPYLNLPMALDVVNVDLRDDIGTFVEQTDLNAFVDPEVQGTVTVKFRDVPWGRVLDLILRMHNCRYVLEGNVLWIAPLAKLAASERPVPWILPCKTPPTPTPDSPYLNLPMALDFLKGIFGTSSRRSSSERISMPSSIPRSREL